MAIQYAMVARGSVVLAEFSSAAQSNAGAIARQILEKIPGADDSHASYSQDRHIFHVKRTDGITVLCMADDASGRRIPFAFLEDIHGRFVKTYGRACHTALAYAMNEEFSRVLSQQMEYYTNDPNADRMNRMKGEMSQVRNVMIENIDKVLERGERLDLLVDKTSNMQGNTIRFRKQSRRFRSTMWWRNVKLTIVLILVLLVIIYVVLAFVCHGITLPTCLRFAWSQIRSHPLPRRIRRHPSTPPDPHRHAAAINGSPPESPNPISVGSLVRKHPKHASSFVMTFLNVLKKDRDFSAEF